MAVVDGNGLPIGLHVASAQPHEVTPVSYTHLDVYKRQVRDCTTRKTV